MLQPQKNQVIWLNQLEMQKFRLTLKQAQEAAKQHWTMHKDRN